MFEFILKRDGTQVPFRIEKIEVAIEKAFEADGGKLPHNSAELAEAVVLFLKKNDVTRPHIEEVQDMVELVLANTGFARVAKKYILYREKRRKLRNQLKVDFKEETMEDSLPLVVDATYQGVDSPWDTKIIVDQLNQELNLPTEIAREIASKVENKILHLSLPKVSMSLIMEITKNILNDYGYGHLLLKESKIGLPIRELEALHFRSRETAKNNPDKIRNSIATHALNKFSLQTIYHFETVEAHKSGRIHLHDLGFPASLQNFIFTPDLVKKSGLQLNGLEVRSAPARHLKTLSNHLNTFMTGLRPYFCKQFSIAYLNIMVAPFIKDMDNEELFQEAQNLIYVTSQNSFSRGGVPLPVDFNLYTYVPKEIASSKAIGLGGIETQLFYSDYKKESLAFAKAVLLCIDKGDANGDHFQYPEINIHYAEQDTNDTELEDFFQIAAKVASRRPNIKFIRNDKNISLFSSQSFFNNAELDGFEGNDFRFFRLASFCSISINLPHILLRRGLKYKGLTLNNLNSELTSLMNLVLQGIQQKKSFVQDLILSDDSILSELLNIQIDELRMVPIEKVPSLVSLVGLNEFVELATGNQIHYNDESLNFAVDVVRDFNEILRGYQDNGKILWEHYPDKIASHRFAKLDSQKSHEIQKVIRGGLPGYYSNGITLNPEIRLPSDEKRNLESKLIRATGLPASVVQSPGKGVGVNQIINIL